MRFILIFLLGAGLVCAQQQADSPEALKARQEYERVKALVDSGVAPRARLDKVDEQLADARDEATLRRTLYADVNTEDFTAEQAAEMVSAAERRVKRTEAEEARLRELVEQGALPRNALKTVTEDLEYRRLTLKMARTRASLLEEIVSLLRAEEALVASHQESSDGEAQPLAERYDGRGMFTTVQFKKMLLAYEGEFKRPLPISARGDTKLHRSLGFDHRDRIDVALNPDQAEGVWLRRFLESEGIPYFAFRGAVAGSATGAHIHVGPPSMRVRAAD